MTRLCIIFFLCQTLFGNMRVEKIFELTCFSEPAISYDAGHLFVWANSKLIVLKNDKMEKEVPFRIGQGPGEVSGVNGDVFNGGSYFLWDRSQRRLSKFSRNWDFINFQKIPELGMSVLCGKNEEGYIFKYWKIDSNGDTCDSLGFFKNGKLTTFANVCGPIMKSKTQVNYDRPILMSAIAGDQIFHGSNLKYTIKVGDIHNPQETLYEIVGKTAESEWRNNETVRNLFLKYHSMDPEHTTISHSELERLPTNAPPIFTLIVDGDLLGVVTNAGLSRSETSVELWRKQTYLGSVSIPLIYTQSEVIFMSRLGSEGIFLEGEKIYSLHYNLEEGEWAVNTWKILFD